MKRQPRLYLEHILDAARKTVQFTTALDYSDFTDSPLHQSAVIRELLVIGEATKRVSSEFRDTHPDLPWRQMAGMRDFLVHSYDQTDLSVVWETATKDVPSLIEPLEQLLDKLLEESE